MDILQTILVAFGALIGFPALLTAVGNLLAFFGVPLNLDAFYFWGNVLGFLGVAVAVFTGNLAILSGIDVALSGLAKLLVDLLIILGGAATSLSVNLKMQARASAMQVKLFKR